MPLKTGASFFRLLFVVAWVMAMASCHTRILLSQAAVKHDCTDAMHQRISSATYNTKIDFYKKHFSGLLLFKAVNDTNSRVVFVTETGFKIFDFEFTSHNFNIQYCLPPLRRKAILGIFQNDLGQLVRTDTISPVYIMQKDSSITFTFARGKGFFEDYVAGTNCNQLIGMERRGRWIKHVSTKIKGIKNGNFDAIDIYHRFLKLHISLKQIER